MARTFAVEVKRKDLISVYPEDLIINPAKRGREFPPTADKVEELARSIEQQGQLQPVTVSVTFDKRLELEAGFTRCEAIALLNSRESDPAKRRRVECKTQDGNAEEMFLANITENRLRNHTTAIDDAHNIRRLERDFAKTDEEVCAIYADNGKAKSQAWLDGMRKLLTLSKEQQKQIHEGVLSQSTGLVLADMAPEKREQVIADTVEAAGKVTTSELLKAARKTGALSKQTSLKMAEVKSTWEYLKTNDGSAKVVKLASFVLDYQAGKIGEPDLFKVIHDLLGK